MTFPARRSGFTGAPLLLALAGTFLTLLFAFAVNPDFFFIDDRTAQYFPYAFAIKESLLRGEFPFVTTRTFFGSALWLDWQYGIYNPLSLLLCFAVLPQHLALSGFIVAVACCLLTAAGGYALGRAYLLTPWFAALFGLLSALGMYMLYIAASDWTPAAQSFGWFLLAWAALKNIVTRDDQRALRVLAAGAAIYMMFTAGWPHTDGAFALVALIMLGETAGTLPRRTIYLAAGLALGALLCMPALLPVLSAFPWTFRAVEMAQPKLMLAPTLLDLLNISTPGWWPRMPLWSARSSMDAIPLFYAAWFALPALFFIRWRVVDWRQHAGILALLGLLFLLAAGIPPRQLLNYPVRWIPMLHACFLLFLLSLLQDEAIAQVTKRRFVAASAATAIAVAASFLPHPDMNGRLILALLPLLLMPLFLYAGTRKEFALCMGVSSVLVAVAVVQVYPYSSFLNYWQKNDTTASSTPQPLDPVSYTLFAGWPRLNTELPGKPIDPAIEREFPAAALGLYYGLDTINGYSSIGQRNISQAFACPAQGPLCLILSVPPLLRIEPETQASFLDLLKVNRVVADRPEADKTAKVLKGWSRHPGQTVVSFDRPHPLASPGTVSWHSPGLRVESSLKAGGDEEDVRVKAAAAPGLVVFSRLYYPGFGAMLGNSQLNVRPVSGLLVGVDIPSHTDGTLKLVFRPPHFATSIFLAAAGLLIWGLWALIAKFKVRK